MVRAIKGEPVRGIVTDKGKCPCCNKYIVSRDDEGGYWFLNERGRMKHDDGEVYVRCNKCGNIVMLPREAA